MTTDSQQADLQQADLKQNPAPSVIKMDAEMTIYHAEAIRQTLLGAIGRLSAPTPALDIDLAAVSEIDCAGLQILMSAKKYAESRQKAVRLIRHSEAVQEAFDLLKLSNHFEDALVMPARSQADMHRTTGAQADRTAR